MQGSCVFQLLFSPDVQVWDTGSAEAGEEKGEAELHVGDWGCLEHPQAGRTFG